LGVNFHSQTLRHNNSFQQDRYGKAGKSVAFPEITFISAVFLAKPQFMLQVDVII